MVSAKTLSIVKKTLPAVAKAGPAFTDHFYKRMFAANPELMNTFNVTNQMQGKQQKALFNAIAVSAVSVLENGTLPTALLEGVNQKHCALNIVPVQYDIVGQHILGTIEEMLNPGQEVLDAWGELYGALAGHCVAREEEIYQDVESRSGGWRGTRAFTLSAKEAQSSNITKFTFTPADGKPMCTFSPGQFATVWVKPGEKRQPRHYSIVSDPRDAKSVSIAVKREDKGLVSTYLHDQAKCGDEIELSPPYGAFSIEGVQELWTSEPSAGVVLLSAGVGITPMLSILGNLKGPADGTSKRQVVWAHAARNGGEHAFCDYLTGLAKAHPDTLTRRVWYSSPGPDDVRGDGDNKAAYHFDGRMDLGQIRDLLPLGDQNARYFFCGPVAWMAVVAKQLVDLGVPRKALNFEVYGPASEVLPDE